MRWILVLVLLAPALAGCLQGEPATDDLELPRRPDAVPAAALEADIFYAFDHLGGPLRLEAVEGGAEMILWDGGDRRVGGVRLGNGTPLGETAAFAHVPAGEAVIRLAELEGGVRVQSAGQAVEAFTPLVRHVERHVLAEGRDGSLRLPPGPEPVRDELEVGLLRTPAHLQVLSSGQHGALHVVATGPRGVVLEIHDAGTAPLDLPFQGGFRTLPAQTHPESMVAGALRVRVEAERLDGAVVLEAWSFSRLQPLQEAGARPAGPAAYTYGAVPDRPALFTVHPDATQITLHNVGDGPAAVVLFGPDDARLGAYRLEVGGRLAVPAAGGDHVAVALAGKVEVGADAVPADLDTLHVLDRVRVDLPRDVPGEGGRYGQLSEEGGQGVVYAVEPAPRPYSPQALVSLCVAGSVRAVQDGESLGQWGDTAWQADPVEAALRLRDGPVTVAADGFGESCNGPALALWGYVRP